MTLLRFDNSSEGWCDLSDPRIDYVGSIQPQSCQTQPQEHLIKEAFECPVNSPRLSQVARNTVRGGTVTILVSDSTRGVPTARILPYVMKELDDGGVKPEQVRVIVAVGAHRPATGAELDAMLGEYYGLLKACSHDMFNKEGLVYLGQTSTGTPVWINRDVMESRLRIIIGRVEPHMFAGYSGGRKSIVPGVAGEETVKANHAPWRISDPQCIAGVMDGNPVHQDMMEASEMVGDLFLINIVMDSSGQIVAATTGDLKYSHERATDLASRIFKVSVPMPLDLVMGRPTPPLDINLYQALKGLIDPAHIVRDEGWMILYAPCPEGIGSDDMLVPFRGAKTPQEVVRNAERDYRIEMDLAVLLSTRVHRRGIKTVAVCRGVDDNSLMLMHMTPKRDLNEALNYVLKESESSRLRAMSLPMATSVVPHLETKGE